MICEHSEELVRSSLPIIDSSLTKCCTQWEDGKTITDQAKRLIGARKSSYALTSTKDKPEAGYNYTNPTIQSRPYPTEQQVYSFSLFFLTSISLSSCLLDASSCSTALISCPVYDCLGESASNDRTLDLSEGLVLSAPGSVNAVCRLASSSLLMLFAPPKAILTKDCPGERCITSTAIAQYSQSRLSGYEAHVCCNRGIYKGSWCSRETN